MSAYDEKSFAALKPQPASPIAATSSTRRKLFMRQDARRWRHFAGSSPHPVADFVVALHARARIELDVAVRRKRRLRQDQARLLERRDELLEIAGVLAVVGLDHGRRQRIAAGEADETAALRSQHARMKA